MYTDWKRKKGFSLKEKIKLERRTRTTHVEPSTLCFGALPIGTTASIVTTDYSATESETINVNSDQN